MVKEFNILLNAVLYYTRIPVPKSVECNEQTLKSAFRYFPFVGLVVGALGAVIPYLLGDYMPVDVVIVLSMIVVIFITGALHEDGLADFADGFGAGRDKESILRIMKDSFIGSYGVIVLILMLLLKFSLLKSVPLSYLPLVIIAAQGASRFPSVLMPACSSYARKENAKALHTALGVSRASIIIAFATAFLPLFFINWIFAVTYLFLQLILFYIFRYYIQRKIGGFTGDTLGALQQLSELLFYFVFIILIKGEF